MKYPTLRLGAVASICIILSACGAGSPSHGGSSSSAKRTAPPPPVELVPSTERLFARATGNTLPLSASGAIGSVSVPAAGPRAGQTLITVSGVRFNVSTATIRRGALALTVASLRAGQTVTVNGTLTRGSAVVDADDVIVSAGVVGTVDTIDLTTGSVQVQGQTVHVDDTTTYTGSVGSGSTAAAFTGLDQLAAGNVLDVVGLFNEDGSLQAGAINYVADTFVVDEMTISVTGPVSGLETTAMAFNINAATVDYAGAEMLDFPVA
ncbi:MAG: DUF5666 domain-containing protein, partial [Gammaproteobacteria bacterium]|nr:DUF5666 domain-containing protein [Gammaproteobacteria bacterium]